MSRDRTDRNRLITENMKLAQAATSSLRHYYPENTYEDFLSVAYLGLCEAADSYDPDKGAFSTWAFIRIKYLIYEELKKTYKRGLSGESMNTNLFINDGETALQEVAVADEYAEAELRCSVQKFLDNNYPEFYQEVLQLLEAGYDYKTIGYLVAKEPAYLRTMVSELRKKLRQQILAV